MMNDNDLRWATLTSAGGRWQLTFERQLPASAETVWSSLTEPDQVAAWFPCDIEGDRVAGAPLRFVFRHDEGPEFDGTMVTCDPPKALSFTWKFDLLSFDLLPHDAGCSLIFSVAFDEIGRATRDAAGWHVCLDTLENLLAGTSTEATPRQQWDAVHAGYVERFGDAASTIGPPPTMARHPDWAN